MDRKTEKENILQFNPANATREQICLWLYTIINCELEKPQEIRDEELIQECSDFDALLFEAEDNLSDAEIEMRISKIKEKALVIPSSEQTSVQNRIKRKRPLKIISVIAAAFLIATITITTIAALNGMSAVEFIRANIDKFRNMERGDVIEGEGILLIKGGRIVEYKTIEEALIEGNINIMYPSVLPEGVEITQINQSFRDSDDYYTISFITDTDTIKISARNHMLTNPSGFEQRTKYEFGNIIYYIFEGENLYIASCQYEGFEYYVECNNYNDLQLIINNLKGIEK